jgi:hypothetical protein
MTHLNGRTGIPLGEWRAERLKLASESQKLSAELHALKGEIKKVEAIRPHAEGIERAVVPKQMNKSQDRGI